MALAPAHRQRATRSRNILPTLWLLQVSWLNTWGEAADFRCFYQNNAWFAKTLRRTVIFFFRACIIPSYAASGERNLHPIPRKVVIFPLFLQEWIANETFEVNNEHIP